MSRVFMSSIAPLAIGIIVLAIWYLRCRHKQWPRRRIEYVWAFVDSSVAYVMLAILVAHNGYGIKFSDIFAHGFGETQVNLAFIGALFEAGWALWDMWNGDGINPIPHA